MSSSQNLRLGGLLGQEALECPDISLLSPTVGMLEVGVAKEAAGLQSDPLRSGQPSPLPSPHLLGVVQ